MLSHSSDKHITGIWSTLVIGSCFQSCMEDRTDWDMYEASQWQKFTVSPRQNGTGLKLINTLVFYQMEFHLKTIYMLSFHCALELISFVMLVIDIVKQEYSWWHSYIASIDNAIKLLRPVSDTWFSLWLLICMAPNQYQNKSKLIISWNYIYMYKFNGYLHQNFNIYIVYEWINILQISYRMAFFFFNKMTAFP